MKEIENEIKKIRRKISKLERYSAINEVLKLLQRKNVFEDKSGVKPWIACILLDWIFELSPINGQKFKTRDIITLYNKIDDVQGKFFLKNAEFNHILAFRTFFISQERFQKPLSYHANSLIRDYMIMQHYSCNSWMNKSVFEKYKVDMEELFLFILSLNLSFANGNRYYLNYDAFLVNSSPGFSPETILKTLELAFINPSDNQNESLIQRSDILYSSPKSINTPFFCLETGIYTPHPYIAAIGTGELLFNSIKDINPQEFKDKFSKAFEAYVHDVIDETELNFTHEDEQKELYKKIYGKKDGLKLIDFITSSEEGCTYIDSKAVEPSEKILITSNAKILIGKIEKIIYGIEQAALSSKRLLDLGNDFSTSIEKRYALVITNKEFYLGSGNNLKKSLDEKSLEELEKVVKGELLIENIFVCNITDFEEIMQICKRYDISLEKFLGSIVQKENEIDCTHMTINSAINEFMADNPIDDEFSLQSKKITAFTDAMHEKLMKRLDDSMPYWKNNSISKQIEYINFVKEIKNRALI